MRGGGGLVVVALVAAAVVTGALVLLDELPPQALAISTTAAAGISAVTLFTLTGKTPRRGRSFPRRGASFPQSRRSAHGKGALHPGGAMARDAAVEGVSPRLERDAQGLRPSTECRRGADDRTIGPRDREVVGQRRGVCEDDLDLACFGGERRLGELQLACWTGRLG